MKKILMVMFLSLMSINVFGLVIPPLKCVPNPCTKDYEACNTNDGTCYCSSETVRMNDGTCDFLGDTFTEEYFPTITEPGIYTGYLDDRYTNAYKSSCASGMTTINPATGKPYPIETGKDRIYQLYLTKSQVITISLTGNINTLKNPVLSVLKASNKQVMSCNDNIARDNKNSKIENLNLPAGLYYIVVDTVNTYEYGYFTLDITFQASCINIDCQSHGECKTDSGIAQCNCFDGYVNPTYSNTMCLSVCYNVNCPSNSVCVVGNNFQPYCDCNVGYTMTNGLCVDNCSNPDNSCGEHGICIHTTSYGNEVDCLCDEGYTAFGSCYWTDYYGGSLDTHMGSGSTENGFRNDRFNWWVDIMNDNNPAPNGLREEIIKDPHTKEAYTYDWNAWKFFVDIIFDSVIWYNVSHGYHNKKTTEHFNQECYDSCNIGNMFGGNATCRIACTTYTYSGERYEMGIVFGDWDLKIDFNEFFPENTNEERRLTWFTTTACHSGDNEGRTDANGKKFYTIWNFNVKNMMSLNTIKNPNGYFGTDGLFTSAWSTNEQGEDFAMSYAVDKNHLKYAWQWSYEDWLIRNDSRIVYTGKDKSDCFNRMGKDYYNPDTSEKEHRQNRLSKEQINSYCYRLYYNNWDEDTYKGNGELD